MIILGFETNLPPIMELSCVVQNRKCVHYGADENPIVEIFSSAERFERDVRYMFIVYVLQGNLQLSYGLIENYPLGEGDLMLFPPGDRIVGSTSEKAKVIVFRIKHHVSLCDEALLETLYRSQDTARLRHTHLAANAMIRAHMGLLAENIENGLLCVRFMTMKAQELLLYLRAYYTDEELARFNMPLLSPDAQFMNFVWQKHREAHNVKQFARMANSSESAFKVKFKKVTGKSPSQWLEEQKIRDVYHEISCGQKTLKEIGREYHFASPSHLGTFCLKHFGKSPGQLRTGK
jgi:AraC-like DNA-binding protein